MALYEVTLVKANGQTETRYTDWPLEVGTTVAIDGRSMNVVARRPDAANPAASERFVCEESTDRVA
jgi:hypothetical protein